MWHANEGLAAIELMRLLDAYGEPHRRYHDSLHLLEVLQTLGRLGNEDPAVWIAALYHDAVYDPRSATNEEDSVVFMREAHEAMGVEPLPSIAPLILATKTHIAETPEAAMLLDADLAILGSDPARYAEYAQVIRKEYAHVPEAAYRTGRAAVLRSFLDRDQIFQTNEMARYEAIAGENIARELKGLE